MSFQVDQLSPDKVLRGTYDEVSLERFADDVEQECAQTRIGTAIGGALIILVLVALALWVRRVRRNGRPWLIRSAEVMSACVAGGAGVAMLWSGISTYESPIGWIAPAVLFGFVGGLVLGFVLSPVALLVAVLLEKLTGAVQKTLTRLLIGAVTLTAGVLLIGRSGEAVALLLAVCTGLACTPTREPSTALRPHSRPSVSQLGLVALAAIAASVLSVLLLRNPSDELSDAAKAIPLNEVRSIQLRPQDEVLADERSDGDNAVSLTFQSNGVYTIRTECSGTSAQVGEGHSLTGGFAGSRRLLPCDGQPVAGSYPDAAPGTPIRITVSSPGSERTRVIVTATD